MKFSATSVMMFLCGQNIAKAFAFSGSRPLTAVSSRATRVLSSAATEEAAPAAAEKEEPKKPDLPDMEEIVSLCKRRGIIFPSSEIYNGYAGFFDYGPLGSELKKNLKDVWWQHFVTKREDVVGLDSSIIHNPTTWKSSGTFPSKKNRFATMQLRKYLFALHTCALTHIFTFHYFFKRNRQNTTSKTNN